MTKKTIVSIILTLLSASSSLVHAAHHRRHTVSDYTPQVDCNFTEALIKTPSEEDFHYAPEAAQALIEATVFAETLEQIITILPSDFKGRDDIITYLQQTNDTITTLESLMKEVTKSHTYSSSLTAEEIQSNANLQVAGILERTTQLMELLPAIFLSENTAISHEVHIKILQFAADLAATTSSMAVGLEKETKEGHQEVANNQTSNSACQSKYFIAADVEAILTNDLEDIKIAMTN